MLKIGEGLGNTTEFTLLMDDLQHHSCVSTSFFVVDSSSEIVQNLGGERII